MKVLQLYVLHADGEIEPILFRYEKLVLGGWSGRNKEDVLAHVEELRKLGIPAPSEVPSFFYVGTNLLTSDREIKVLRGKNNGEVEYVLFLDEGKPRYVTVGSDHTDREVERTSFQISKQLYPKIISPVVWDYEEIYDHWDTLILRMYVDGKLSQEASLKSLLRPQDLIKEAGLNEDNAVLFSGSIPWKGGEVAFGRKYRIEMEDPILRRKIYYVYETHELP